MNRWRKISTAPKDGRTIMTLGSLGNLHFAMWDKGLDGEMGWWDPWDEGWDVSDVVYWMPAPIPVMPKEIFNSLARDIRKSGEMVISDNSGGISREAFKSGKYIPHAKM